MNWRNGSCTSGRRFKKKLEFEMEVEKKEAEQEMAKPQAVKLQKYTITPFQGDCKDWL